MTSYGIFGFRLLGFRRLLLKLGRFAVLVGIHCFAFKRLEQNNETSICCPIFNKCKLISRTRPEKSRTGEGEVFPVLWHHVSGFQWKKRRRRKTMMRQQKTATIPFIHFRCYIILLYVLYAIMFIHNNII